MYRSFLVSLSASGLVVLLFLSACAGAEKAMSSSGMPIEAWLSATAPSQEHKHEARVGPPGIEHKSSLVPRIKQAAYPSSDAGDAGGSARGDHDSSGKPSEVLVGGLDLWPSFLYVTPPSVAGDWLHQAFPLLSGRPIHISRCSSPEGLDKVPALLQREQLPYLLEQPELMKSVGGFPTGPQGGYSHLQIEVDHSEHVLKVYGNSYFGSRDLLYTCEVGLGASSFPTPEGLYFVTHIYDDDPWWIPPKNRAWAWGQSPSKRVYGGTMAPLLKKRPQRSSRRRSKSVSEDFIAGKVRLDDYGYRFHGTNAPRSIGRNESHGCVRMLPKDARRVADLIKGYVGTVARKESQNGTFVVLRAPVRLELIK